jgi:hypothetical protein
MHPRLAGASRCGDRPGPVARAERSADSHPERVGIALALAAADGLANTRERDGHAGTAAREPGAGRLTDPSGHALAGRGDTVACALSRTYTHSNPDCRADPYTNADTTSDTTSDATSDATSDTSSDADTSSDTDTHTDTNTDTNTDTHTNADPAGPCHRVTRRGEQAGRRSGAAGHPAGRQPIGHRVHVPGWRLDLRWTE